MTYEHAQEIRPQDQQFIPWLDQLAAGGLGVDRDDDGVDGARAGTNHQRWPASSGAVGVVRAAAGEG